MKCTFKVTVLGQKVDVVSLVNPSSLWFRLVSLTQVSPSS